MFLLFQGDIFRFHVSFRGCRSRHFSFYFLPVGEGCAFLSLVFFEIMMIPCGNPSEPSILCMICSMICNVYTYIIQYISIFIHIYIYIQ